MPVMAEKLVRVYKKLDVSLVKSQLLIYGDLGGSCAHCSEMNVKLSDTHCPQCKTEFKYISFRDVKTQLPKIFKLFEERPSLVIVDFEDYKRNIGALKAEEFLK